MVYVPSVILVVASVVVPVVAAFFIPTKVGTRPRNTSWQNYKHDVIDCCAMTKGDDNHDSDFGDNLDVAGGLRPCQKRRQPR